MYVSFDSSRLMETPNFDATERKLSPPVLIIPSLWVPDALAQQAHYSFLLHLALLVPVSALSFSAGRALNLTVITMVVLPHLLDQHRHVPTGQEMLAAVAHRQQVVQVHRLRRLRLYPSRRPSLDSLPVLQALVVDWSARPECRIPDHGHLPDPKRLRWGLLQANLLQVTPAQ